MTEKIQKILARVGLASRREIERWIVAGRVKINNKIAKLGDRASETDALHVDERRITLPQNRIKTRVIVYNKPVGQICTRNDPEKRTTVFDNLPPLKTGRWINIGRLDINSSGVLLLTNDGALAHRLMHPSSEIEREYLARVLGTAEPDQLQRLKKGVELEDGMAHFDRITDGGGESINHWYKVVVKQGKNRLVRRLFQSQDLPVNRLIRTRFGSIRLTKDVFAGHWRELSEIEIKSLKKNIKKSV